jgi:hypothetical protein
MQLPQQFERVEQTAALHSSHPDEAVQWSWCATEHHA